jgi:hypothetical protein
MADRELLEWLGITVADLLVSLATIAIAAMFFVTDPTVDVILAVVGIGLALAACPFGMKRRPDLSNFTNTAKLVAYPVYVLLAVGAVVIHYVWFTK